MRARVRPGARLCVRPCVRPGVHVACRHVWSCVSSRLPLCLHHNQNTYDIPIPHSSLSQSKYGTIAYVYVLELAYVYVLELTYVYVVGSVDFEYGEWNESRLHHLATQGVRNQRIGWIYFVNLLITWGRYYEPLRLTKAGIPDRQRCRQQMHSLVRKSSFSKAQ